MFAINQPIGRCGDTLPLIFPAEPANRVIVLVERHSRVEHFQMKSIDLYKLYELAKQLGGINSLEQEIAVGELYIPVTTVISAMDNFLADQSMDWSVSKPDAEKLRNEAVVLYEAYYKNGETGEFEWPKNADSMVPTWMSANLRDALSRFEHVLQAETRRAPTYLAAKIGIYETEDLVERGDQSFPNECQPKINKDAIAEYQSAGRALAFNLPTAAGFHVARAVEIVMKDYHKHFVSTGKKPKNMGEIISNLEKQLEKKGARKKPDAKTIRCLDQIRDLDRNRLMHPEDTLSPDDSLVFFNNGISAIVSMVRELP